MLASRVRMYMVKLMERSVTNQLPELLNAVLTSPLTSSTTQASSKSSLSTAIRHTKLQLKLSELIAQRIPIRR